MYMMHKIADNESMASPLDEERLGESDQTKSEVHSRLRINCLLSAGVMLSIKHRDPMMDIIRPANE